MRLSAMSTNDTDKKRRNNRKAYEVGYGKPPIKQRFRPGVSGNPKGRRRKTAAQNTRPVADPSAHRERLNEIILEEAYRLITVRDGEKMVKMSALQATMRTIAVQAVKGDRRSQKMLTEMIVAVESGKKAESDELLKALIEYKYNTEEELELRKSLGIKGPAPVPHPADIHIDFANNTAEIKGPVTKEGKALLDKMKAMKRETDANVSRLKRELSKDPGNLEIREELEREIESQDRLGSIIENAGLKFSD